MSLLQEAMEPFRVLDQKTIADGYGGFVRIWEPGAVISAAVLFDNSTEARSAEVMGTTALYTIYTSKAVNLMYHDVVKRMSDGKIFRVTSDGEDDKTPQSAGLDIRKVAAERWELTDG